MRIWIDLANSPHVAFFRSLIPEFKRRQHEVVVSARDFAETVPLATSFGLDPQIIGAHGGGKLTGKAGNLVQRAMSLARWARSKNFDLAVSHNSYSQILAARALSLKTVTLMDYEHQPANHMAFRMASRVIVPQAFPDAALQKFGAAADKVRRYDGIKEDVYLAGFQGDPEFSSQLHQLGVTPHDVLVVVRSPASEALYHRFENQLFDQLLKKLLATPGAKVILLPRNNQQREYFSRTGAANLIIPRQPLDGANLIASSDLVISAGGTMNREAAALGVPAASIYLGEWAALDEHLVREGRLKKIAAASDIEALNVEKKGATTPRLAAKVLAEVADLILTA